MPKDAKAPASAQKLIDRILAKCSEGKFIFRGTTKICSKKEDGKGVQSSLYKRFIKVDGVICQHYLPPDIEKYILENAKKHFPDSASNIEILTDLRHHDGKVNLIDFTRSLYVALFFACHGEYQEEGGKPQEEDGEVIVLNTENLPSQKDVDYEQLKSPSLFIINPSSIQASRSRVIAQHSVFVYSTKGYIEESLYTPERIPHGLKKEILHHIKKFHSIDEDSVYNDLIGVIQNEYNLKSSRNEFHRANAKSRSSKDTTRSDSEL